MSKTYSMAGWRIGFAVGNERLIAALARVKSYLDYGAFTPVQAAATAALNGPQDIVANARALQEAPRRAGRMLRPRRLGDPAAAGLDVRLGADPRAFRNLGSDRILQSC
jgi:alanine-synthesizing transaminase